MLRLNVEVFAPGQLFPLDIIEIPSSEFRFNHHYDE